MKAFVIALSSFDESIQSANQTLTQLLDYGFDAELFEGTPGDQAEQLFGQQQRILDPALKENWKTTSPGVKGCFYSHYRLWNLCVELDMPIAIFEDDVVFYRNYEPISFDQVLILSINFDWKAADPYKTYLLDEHSINERVQYTTQHMPGASGYLITPVAAKQLVKTYSQTFLPADRAINVNVCDIKLHPRLMGRSKTMKEKQSMTRIKAWSIASNKYSNI